MSCILFAWELGANLGHLARDLLLAQACRDAGHEVVMAVSDLRMAAALLKEEEFTLIQAPMLRQSIKDAPPVNYADMLLHEGYDDAASLTTVLTAWENLIERIHPALMIYNHAPTALIAARVKELSVVVTGPGFEIPPAVSPLPSFRPWQQIPRGVLQHAEERVLSHINRQLTSRGKAAVTYLYDLFGDPHRQLMTTFPELDPFGPRSDVDYIGPIYVLPNMPAIGWQGDSKRRIFVYLRPSVKYCEQLLSTLQQLDAEVLCVVPNAPDEWITKYHRLRLIVHPVNLHSLLPEADVVVTYGSGTIAAALLVGVPVLVVPQTVEQYLAGLPLEKIGAGLILRDRKSTYHFKGLISALLMNSRYRRAAVAFAKRHADFSVARASRQQWEIVASRINY